MLNKGFRTTTAFCPEMPIAYGYFPNQESPTFSAMFKKFEEIEVVFYHTNDLTEQDMMNMDALKIATVEELKKHTELVAQLKVMSLELGE
jgi:hypothetical protein